MKRFLLSAVKNPLAYIVGLAFLGAACVATGILIQFGAGWALMASGVFLIFAAGYITKGLTPNG